jgi:LPS export ABC transporter protein LptC
VSTLSFEGYSEGVNTIIFDAEGKIDYTLQATKQITYSDDVTELEKPFIQLYQDDDTHWNITADSGKLSTASDNSNDINRIDLAGDVEVFQFDSLGNRTVIATDFLTVDPINELLNTEVLVTIFSEDLEQTAIGMQADLSSDEYVFLRQTRGRYAN